MKRSQLLRHMREHGCELLREGGRHSWWHNLGLNTRSRLNGPEIKRAGVIYF